MRGARVASPPRRRQRARSAAPSRGRRRHDHDLRVAARHCAAAVGCRDGRCLGPCGVNPGRLSLVLRLDPTEGPCRQRGRIRSLGEGRRRLQRVQQSKTTRMLIAARSVVPASRLAGNPAMRRLGRRVLLRRDEAGVQGRSAAPDDQHQRPLVGRRRVLDMDAEELSRASRCPGQWRRPTLTPRRALVTRRRGT